MTTLILGATGRIGRHLSQGLADTGRPVRCASRQPTSQLDVRFDWRDRSTWPGALDGVDGLFLMTPESEGNLGEEGSQFVAAAAQAGVEHVVLLSALCVDKAPDATGMLRIEQAVADAFESHSILRPNTFMQNFTTGPFALPIIDRNTLVAPVGDAAVSFIDAIDIANCATHELGEHPTRGTLVLTGGKALSFAEAAQLISAATGRDVSFVDPGVDGMRYLLQATPAPPPVIDMILGFYATLASGAHAIVTTTVEELTGQQPNTFRDFCEANATAWSVM